MLSAVQFVDKGKVERDIEAERKDRRREKKREKKVGGRCANSQTFSTVSISTIHERTIYPIWDGVSISDGGFNGLFSCAGETKG